MSGTADVPVSTPSASLMTSSPTTAAPSALVVERAKATFDSAHLCDYIHGKANRQLYREVEGLFASLPLFDKSHDIHMTRKEYLDRAVARSMETYRIVKKNPKLLSAHSPIHGKGGFFLGSLNVSAGLSDHFSLFLTTIMVQGTPEQQRQWLGPSVNLKIIGTYAQTELGHGSNIRALETTATYDRETDEFIIHSPTLTSTKWWPGALGLQATHAIVYAHLLINNTDHGFNAFICQIRNDAHAAMPGVTVGDLGPKMGSYAYDSGFLRFDQVRVPRSHMLARFQRVEKGGKYVPGPPALQKIGYVSMLRLRVYIAKVAADNLARVVTIATRYSCVRKQGYISRSSPEERTILDYPYHQRQLIPLIATTFALHFSGIAYVRIFDDFIASLKTVTEANIDKIDFSSLPHLHGNASGMKAFNTLLSTDGQEECRKLCGGHGYWLASGIGVPLLTSLAAPTYEGDVIPMALQCARYLVGSFFAATQGGEKRRKLIGSPVEYLLQKNETLPSSVADFTSLPKLVKLYERAARAAVKEASMSLYRLGAGKKKLSKDEAWNASHGVLIRAAHAHTMLLNVRHFALGVTAAPDEGVRRVLERACALFALHTLKSIGVQYHGIGPVAYPKVEEALAEMLHVLRPDALALIEGWGFTDFQLQSAIGASDDHDMYRRMLAEARTSCLNTSAEFQEAVRREILDGFIDKKYVQSKL